MPTQQRKGRKNYELLSASFIGCVEATQHTTYQPTHCFCSTCGFSEGDRHWHKVGNTIDCFASYPGQWEEGRVSKWLIPGHLSLLPWTLRMKCSINDFSLLRSNADQPYSNGGDLKKCASLPSQSKIHGNNWGLILQVVYLTTFCLSLK